MAKSNGFLIDTEIFIWGMEKGSRLSSEIKFLLQNPENQVFLSVASVWEMVIKKVRGKLKIPKKIEESIKEAGFDLLPIEISHVLGIEKLPQYHKDPFDRILIAQSKAENLRLITSDEKIWKYDLPLLKA